ncbi:acyl-CoA reductase [Larkinella soli]|uniref:acyl-CoA reductase n=1 Tax=Larkinella soli TaxID=1770527 RepID=UPI000FFBC662|nr:acyl-CoA reductase [Larkinella soli]
MVLSDRLNTFIQLGNFLKSPENAAELQEIEERAYLKNPWFTPANSAHSLAAIASEFLNEEKLSAWIKSYNPEPKAPKNVGVVLAGNIPAIGFHDVLSVLISGHRLMAKPSSQDFVLIQYLIQKIVEINPAFTEAIQFSERLNQAEAYIATGSDNTARYFEYYFSKKPNIIRRNRTSVGVLTGRETDADLLALGHDILDYYGLGCRNVSTVFVPEGYDFIPLLRLLEPQGIAFTSHHKYNNNYDYNKSIYLVNGVPHFDNGFLLITENQGLVSPISVLYFQHYADAGSLAARLTELEPKIQCIASADAHYPGSVAFGHTQRPGLADYADRVDTMAFLSQLGRQE